jgi:hypothetical protein
MSPILCHLINPVENCGAREHRSFNLCNSTWKKYVVKLPHKEIYPKKIPKLD